MGVSINNLQIAVVGRANVGKSRLIKCIFNPEQFNATDTLENLHQGITTVDITLPNGKFALIRMFIIGDDWDFSLFQQTLTQLNVVILVLDAREELYKSETELIAFLQKTRMPFLVAVNKIEFGTNPYLLTELDALEANYFELSCKENAGLESFRITLIRLLK